MSVAKWVVAAVIAGSLFGTLRAWSEFRFSGEQFLPYNPMADKVKSTGGERSQNAPQVVVLNGESFQFGTMQRGSKMSHRFQIKNVGKSDLELWVGSSTCTCTVASIGGAAEESPEGDVPADDLGEDTKDKVTVPPGEATEVLMQWEATTLSPRYSQSSTIRTNDPDRPNVKLSVNGYVQQMFTVIPDEADLRGVSVDKGGVTVVTIYCVAEEFPEVLSMDFIGGDHRDHFTAEIGPPPEVMEGKVGQSARTITVRALPGLPISLVQQTLRVRLDLEGEDTLDIPVRAHVTSELSLLGGADYHEPSRTLRWGVVDRERGRESTIYVLVKGEHKDKVQLEVDKIDPQGSLIIEVLPAKNPDAAVLTYPVKVRLAPDSPPVSMLGSVDKPRGTVTLRTGHPVAKQLQFRVQFAVN